MHTSHKFSCLSQYYAKTAQIAERQRTLTSENAQIYRKSKQAAKEILEEYPACGKIGASALKKRLYANKAVLAKIKKITQRMDSENMPLSGGYEWIADNYYSIDEKYRSFAHFYKKYPSLQRENVTVTPFPRFYMCFIHYLEYLRRNGLPSDALTLDAFFAAAFSGENYPDYIDIYSFPLLFSAAVIDRIAALCETLSADSRLAEKIGTKMSFYFQTLHMLDAYRFEKVFDYSETERLLNAEPSGFYPQMDEMTKNDYRKRIMALSKKENLSETAFVKGIYEKACQAETERMRHIGAYLYPQRNLLPGVLYFSLLAGFTVGITSYLCLHTLWAVFVLFPVWEAVKTILDRCFARFIKAPELPRLEIQKLPDSDGVLTVITTLLVGGKSDHEIFSRLEKTYLSCGMENTYFALLGDYTDSVHQSAPNDEKILAFAIDRIGALNAKYGNHFSLFMRPRSYCKSQNAFMGYERKRGAVMQLTHFLCTGESAFLENDAMMSQETAKKIRYVITLDSDTNLPLDGVKELVGTMLHPLNRPVIDKQKHRVTAGYGILQPRVGPELSAARKTAYSRVMCGVGGTEIYSFAAFDFYQSLFGNANFCGKGIFDKYAFEETVNAPEVAFPEDSVLSHDILEGERLRTALVNNPTVTDGFPKNELSYFRRHHRWVRGDVQNLAFMGRTFRTGEGLRVKNTLSPLSKFKLFDNVRRECVPVFAFFGLLLANFLPRGTASLVILASVASLLLPLIFDFFTLFRTWSFQCAARRFFSKGVTAGIWESFLRFLLCLSALPKNALVTLDAMIRSLWRMTVSRRNLLEWVTAAQSDSQSDDGILHYVQKNLAGAVIGVLLFIVSPYGILKLFGLMWFFFPAVAWACAKPAKMPQKVPNAQQKAVLRTYASDLWRMYETTVTENDSFLPPDNIQFEPEQKIAHRTSPTNIGLYLASILAARDFGFINSEEMYQRLNETVTTIEALPKWHGHLYNWYETQTLGLLEPRYVSAVDTGNLLACFLVTSEGVKEYASEKAELLDISVRLKKLYEQTDLKIIYNTDRDLFVLGITFDSEGVAHKTEYAFDMLMSEARTLSFIAAARRDVPKKHWNTLSRPLIKQKDRIGIASWTGTAFEYFMPSLFMPSPRGSVLYEALRFAFRAQRERTAALPNGKKVWGISESGFYAFDKQNNYGYQAFGVPLLGYKRGLEKDLVISPYSSFLMLTLDFTLPLANLERLKEYGAYGKLGFYEAVDFTPSRAGKEGRGKIVQSSMAHHVGMSILASANACLDNCMVRRFLSDPVMKSAVSLLEEKIPVNAVIRRVKMCRNEPERSQRPDF